MATRALQLSTILSKETLLENLLPFIPSVEEELERLAKEKEEKLNSTIRIPKSCYNTDTNMIFYLAEQEGVFGTKFLAFQRLSILFP